MVSTGYPQHNATPPIVRGSMVPVPWVGFWRSLRDAVQRRLSGAPAAAPAAAALPWERAAARRRNVLLALIGVSAAGAAALLIHTQPTHESLGLRIGQAALFTLLFAWVAAGFYTALMGFVVQLRGDRHALSMKGLNGRPVDANARTAVIMPICNENVATVYAGLRATAESLMAAGGAGVCDVFVLSDTHRPELRAAEEAAWAQLAARLEATGGPRLYYRWRLRRTRRKAGNVADFCRRFGKAYRYMVVLDADSVMSGDCILNLVRLMEAHPKAGIIQTAPASCGLHTTHARSQQFAGRVTGRLFTAGMQYWQLGESHYWGHNAIIRVEPFMTHCALAPLAGRGGLSGDILSHDFVEAALMRRAGYEVWLAPDLVGSYEQQPPNLLEELSRDRRWCQGNLQNARLIAEPGLRGVHRAMLATGAMAYLSAPLWLGFVVLGAGLWLAGAHPTFDPRQAVPAEMMGLWCATVTMLVLPRVLGIVGIAMRGEQQQYGGTLAMVRGALLEGGLSVLQAPVRMVAHSMFVLTALTGIGLDWKSPPREAQALRWADALRRFGPVGAFVATVFAVALAFDPLAALWLVPVGLPLLLAVPLSVLTSLPSVGERLRRNGLLITPEEVRTPRVLSQAWAYALGRPPIATPRPVALSSLPAGIRAAWR